MWVYDLETLAFLEVNLAAVEKYGYAREEFLKMTLKDIRPSEDVTRLLDTVAKMRLELQHSGEWRHTLRNGRIIDVEVTTHTLAYHGRKAALVIVQDITARKDAEKAILESDIRHRSLFENMLEGFAYCRMLFENGIPVDFEYLEVNKAFERITGLKDVVGKKVTEAIPGIRESNPELFEVYGRVAQTGRPERFEVYLNTLLTWLSISVYTMRAGYFAVVFTDITERKRADEAVKDSEERFRMVFDHVFDGISIYSEDPDPSKRRLIDCNDRYATMAGRSREELLQLGSTLGLQRTLEGAANTIRLESLTSGTAYQDSFSWIRPDGKDNVIEYVGMPIAWRGKSYSIGIDRDITERKRSERELRLMAQTVASAQDCISVTDLEDRFLFVNDAFRRTYGYTTEELLGKDVSIVRPPHKPAATMDQLLHDTLGGGWHGELLNRRKDGSDFPVELWTSVVKDEAGIPVALVGVARNITDRKRAEEHLRESEELFRLIAENVGDMIAVADLDGRRIYNSASYKSILGDPESLKGTDGFQEIHPEDRDRVAQVFRETVRTGVGQRIEYRLIRKDGSVSLIDSKGSVIRDSDGKISRVIVVSRDVTEEKKLAAQFLRAQRMESIGTLAGGIAHDLNNVLTPIMMAIEILRTKLPDPGGQKILNTIEISAKRGSDIVKQVLTFGRGVKGDRILVQLKHVINELVKITGETLPKSIEIKTDIPRDLWTVSADPTQMHQVFLNMLVNARDAMPKGGTLTISAENVTLDENYSRMHLDAKPGAYVFIAITDTGTGIPADIREKIFEPFYTTKEIGMGTGLGLSTTLAIVKSHEGFINLYSEVGKGTTFRIYIPATGTASSAAAASEEADLPMGHGELILVIDDEAAIREITRETLQAYDYEVLTASDGAEGVAVFAENKKTIKAVISDIMMPIMDGTVAIRALQRIDPNVKIIAASGLTTKGQITTPSDANVQAVLTKPYTAEKLLKALAVLLR